MKNNGILEAFKNEEFTEIYYCLNNEKGLKVVFCGKNNYVAKYSYSGSGVYKIEGDVKAHLKKNYLDCTKVTDKGEIESEVEIIIEEINTELEYADME